MRSIFRKSLTASLLVLYTGIALVGPGLHLLSSADHHHHGLAGLRSPNCEHSYSHDCGHHGHGTGHGSNRDGETRQSIAGSECAAHSHECEICAFLFQARSQPPQVATVIFSEPVVADLAPPLPEIYTPAPSGVHAPHGPPLLIG